MSSDTALSAPTAAGPSGLAALILAQTARAQVTITLLSLATLPIGFVVLDATKRLIDRLNAPDISQTMIEALWDGMAVGCGALILQAALKYALALVRSRTAERMRRRLRLGCLRRLGGSAGARRLMGTALAQEVEAVGGLASELVATPLLQAGAIATALTFLAIEHPAFAVAAGLAALAPIAAARPLQHRAAAIAQERAALVRRLNAGLVDAAPIGRVVTDCAAIEQIRLRHARVKFLAKVLANLLIGAAPLAMIALGGWLVAGGDSSVGGVIAAVLASREIGPAIRALTAFEQARIDASLRYEALRRRGLGAP